LVPKFLFCEGLTTPYILKNRLFLYVGLTHQPLSGPYTSTKNLLFLKKRKGKKNARIDLKFSGYLTNTLNNILCFGGILYTLKAFPQQRTEKLTVAKTAAAVKEETHKN
jgi:hypothetical protein